MVEMKRDTGSSISRTVLKAMSIFGGMQVFTILCGIVRTKLVAIWLGTSGVGLFAIYTSALTLVSSLTQLNLRTSAVRTIASHEDPRTLPVTVAVVRRLGLWLGVAGVAVMLLSAPVFSLRTFGTYGVSSMFMLLAPAVFLMALTMTDQVVLQGLGRLRPLAMSNLRGVGAGLIVSVPILYFFRDTGIVWVITAYSFTAWLGVRMARADLPLTGPRPSSGEVWALGRPVLLMGFYLTIAAVTTELCSYIFIAFLNRAGGTAEVGLFQSGYTLVNRYMGMIFSAIGVEFFPRLSSVASHPRRTATFVSHELLLLSCVLLGVVAIFIPLAPVGVRLLYSQEFLGIVPYVLLAMPGVVFQGASWCMAFVMLARGDGKLYMATEVLSAVLTVTLNLLFFHFMGIAGIGLAFTVNNAIYAAIIGAVYYRRYRLRLSRKVLAILAGVFMVLSLMSGIALMFNPWWSAVISVPAIAVAVVSVRKIMG